MVCSIKLINKANSIFSGDVNIDSANKGRFYVHIEDLPKVAYLSFWGGKFNSAFYTDLGGHTHTAAAHTHAISHNHSLSHTHTTSNHQHSHNHRHTMKNHTHSGSSHDHDYDAHTHNLSSHQHSITGSAHDYAFSSYNDDGSLATSGMGSKSLSYADASVAVGYNTANSYTDYQTPAVNNCSDTSTDSYTGTSTTAGGNFTATSAEPTGAGGNVSSVAGGAGATTSTGNASQSSGTKNKTYFTTNNLRVQIDGNTVGNYGSTGAEITGGPIDVLSYLNTIDEHYIDFICLDANAGGRLQYNLILE